MIDDNLPLLLGVFVAALLIQVAIVKRHIKSIADPMTYFIVVSAFSMSMSFVASDDKGLTTRICLYFACFYVGFLIASRQFRTRPDPWPLDKDRRQFRALVVVCCLVYVALNVVIWAQSGFIVFSDDPSALKNDAYTGGFGLIRRYNWSVGVFVLMASIFWWLEERSKGSAIIAALALFTSATGGGKGTLIPALFAFGLFIARPFSSTLGHRAPARIRQWLPLLFLAAGLPVATVLLIEQAQGGNALNAFVVRLFSFGDVLLYWGQESVRQHFSMLGAIDYLKSTFGSILGALRVIDYEAPIGNQFVQYTLPPGVDLSEALGPNMPFYVRGEMYLGVFLAPFHAIAVGMIFGFIRRRFMRYRGRSMLRYSLLAFAVSLSTSLPTDEALTIGQAFDFCIMFVPLYGLVSHFWLGSKRARRKDRSLPALPSPHA